MLDFDIYFAITCFALFEIHALSWRSAESTCDQLLSHHQHQKYTSHVTLKTAGKQLTNKQHQHRKYC